MTQKFERSECSAPHKTWTIETGKSLQSKLQCKLAGGKQTKGEALNSMQIFMPACSFISFTSALSWQFCRKNFYHDWV